jgi:hypothetical protein
MGGLPSSSVTKTFLPACPATKGKCLAIVRLEDGLLSDLGLLLSKLVGTGFAIPRGSVILIGSLTHLLKQGLVSYSMASVRNLKGSLVCSTTMSRQSPLSPSLWQAHATPPSSGG